MEHVNELGQPVGPPVPGWTSRRAPTPKVVTGRWCRLEPLDADRHAAELFAANRRDNTDAMWTYMAYGPFEDLETYMAWIDSVADRDDPIFFAIVPRGGRAAGVAALQRVDRQMGSVEVGHLAFSPELQGTTAATEAIALLASMVFDELGYRRYEWKCDALNAPSRRAARRFGFVYEGTFRQAVVVKGRNRDTAWFSITDSEWPQVRAAYDRWLAPENFAPDGSQLVSLSSLTCAER
ncbi:MAG: GNAT family N-acetyltransferase [Acidimicrobiales bacterium]